MVEAASDDDGFQRACVAGDWQTVEGFLRSRLLNREGRLECSAVRNGVRARSKGTIRVERSQQHVVVGGNFSEPRLLPWGCDSERTGSEGGSRLHFSKVFTSKNDGLDKLALSVPFHPQGVGGPIWVLVQLSQPTQHLAWVDWNDGAAARLS